MWGLLFPCGEPSPGCHRGAGEREAELWLVTHRILNTKHSAGLVAGARYVLLRKGPKRQRTLGGPGLPALTTVFSHHRVRLKFFTCPQAAFMFSSERGTSSLLSRGR